MGKVCVAGCEAVDVRDDGTIRFGAFTLKEGDYLSINGFTGAVYAGHILDGLGLGHRDLAGVHGTPEAVDGALIGFLERGSPGAGRPIVPYARHLASRAADMAHA